MKIAVSSAAFAAAFTAGTTTQLEWLDACANELEVDGVVFALADFPRTDAEYLAQLKKSATDLGLTVAGRRALDVGASTGGFTDCLLQRGAAHVTALDVGYGQIAVTLRNDPRVRVIERTNFRTLAADALPEGPFDVVVIDASFISVIPLLDRARAFLADDGRIVALVKPQFEAGVERLGRGGVVRDADVHRAILREFRAATIGLGLVPQAVVASHLRGPAGNVEFFALVARDGVAVDDAALDAALAGVPA